jgi:hypothetical protein
VAAIEMVSLSRKLQAGGQQLGGSA